MGLVIIIITNYLIKGQKEPDKETDRWLGGNLLERGISLLQLNLPQLYNNQSKYRDQWIIFLTWSDLCGMSSKHPGE